ncbi:MAG: CPBP family intramembrane metalloprotease [Candidatus Moranbacteria bacterium]|nr:CPBP family intramembrane metalloprotease [Candidatus Moranbacteria bacterium]
MLEKIKQNQKINLIFIKILLIYIGFWFLLSNLKTNGVWEMVILNVLFFWALPFFVLKQKFQKKNTLAWLSWKSRLKVILQILGILAVFVFLIVELDGFSFLKLNYLARIDWYLNDWWALFFINLILIPVILFSQEFFLRNFLINKLRKTFSIKMTLVIQAIIFVFFEILFFEVFVWQFVLFNFSLAFCLGWIFVQTKSIWYSFFTRWMLILILDGMILYKIQNLKL